MTQTTSTAADDYAASEELTATVCYYVDEMTDLRAVHAVLAEAHVNIDPEGRVVSTATELVLRHCAEEYRDAAARAEEARLTLGANIRWAVAEGVGEREAARLAGINRGTVRKALGK